MTTPIEVIEQITGLINILDYLELSVLENAIQSRRYDMRKKEGEKFRTIEKVTI
jgi:hypothetical protein